VNDVASLRTICSFTVLPSSSIVRIFWHMLAYRSLGAAGIMSETHEVDADGGDVALCVCVVGEPEQQARLSDTRIADEEELEEVIVSVGRAVSGMLQRRYAAAGCLSRRKYSAHTQS
jgi:hypothetical protein